MTWRNFTPRSGARSENREIKYGYEISLTKWIRAASNFIVPIPPRSVRQMLANFFGVEFWDCIKVQEKNKKVVVLCFRPPQIVKLGTFTSWSCGDGKEMYKKSVMHMQSSC